MNTDRFLDITEISGDEVTQEQVHRMCNRYYWAAQYCEGKDVLEVACGTGQGLGYLARVAKSVVAGDISEKTLNIARNHYGDRFELKVFDASKLPFDDHSKDVIILFETLYYLPNTDAFFRECKRVLRRDGVLLIATANKDLFDFNPSPFTHEYFGVAELHSTLPSHGFEVKCFGQTRVEDVSTRQRVLRPIKRLASSMGVIPKTMKGKKLLKRIVFGGLVKMPAEVSDGLTSLDHFENLHAFEPDRNHKAILCEARLIEH